MGSGKVDFLLLLDLHIFCFFDLVNVTKLRLYVTFCQKPIDKPKGVLYIIITINRERLLR